MLKASSHQGRDPYAPELLHFRKGETIYVEGDPAPSWFMVETGVARTCRFHANGHRQLTGFQYPGDVLGYEQETHRDSAEAVTDVTMRRHRMALPASPAAGDRTTDQSLAITALRNALDNANRCIFLFGRRTAPERLAAFILMTAERLGGYDDIELPMCRTDIADYLGLTIHTVSRTLTQMSRERLITIDGAHRCRILDMPGLRSLAGRHED